MCVGHPAARPGAGPGLADAVAAAAVAVAATLVCRAPVAECGGIRPANTAPPEIAAAPPPASRPAALPKLVLGPENCIDLFGAGVQVDAQGNGSRALFDEQDAAGDPSSNGVGNEPVVNAYMPGWVTWEWFADPATRAPSQNGGIQCAIDLKAVHAVSDIWIAHTHGNAWATIELFLDSPFDAKPVWAVEINNTQVNGIPVNQPPVCNGWGWNQRWCGWNISKTEDAAPKGRYIVFTPRNPVSYFEMVVYGKQQVSPPPPPPRPPRPPPPPPPLMGSFIGVNSFVTEPLARQVAAGWIREYHDWQWDEGADDKCWPAASIKFSPDYSSFQSDPFYRSRAAAGIKTHAVVQGRPLCQFGGPSPNATRANWKCVDSGSNAIGTPETADPASYKQLGAYLFQYAARYGTTKVADSRLTLAAGQARLSGLGWLSGLEVRNEANGAWQGREAFMTPMEQAALLSTAFDGHEGAFGPGVGVRTADPRMLVSMGGLSGATETALDIVTTMKLWFGKNRKDGRFAADALNFHFYCNDDQVTKGASPEDCDFEGVAKNLTAWRDANEPGLQVWLSEFGYDTNEHSPNLAPAYGSFDAQDVQGMWIVRSFLYLALARIDRAQMFMLADTQDDSWNKFATSGLTNCGCTAVCCSSYNPKKSWYFVATMTSILNHTRLAGDASPPPPPPGPRPAGAATGPRVARFARAAAAPGPGPAAVYAVWLGTKTGASTTLAIDVAADAGPATRAVLVRLLGNSTTGLQSALPINAGKVTVVAGEMPVFLLLGDGLAPEPPSGPVPPVDPPVAPMCAGLPRGLYCSANSTGSNASFTVCPGGQPEQCSDGDRCVQVAPGVIDCRPVPGAACAGKPPGLYCDPAAAKAGWPDPYVECPSVAQFYCSSERPRCDQTGATINCSAAR